MLINTLHTTAVSTSECESILAVELDKDSTKSFSFSENSFIAIGYVNGPTLNIVDPLEYVDL